MSNKYEFKSIFKNELNYFIQFKRSSGLKYQNEIFRLKTIDSILFSLRLNSKTITKETFYELIKRNNMQGENYARHYGITLDFLNFLISNGYKNIYYENKKFKLVNNYKPVIFTDKEMITLFETMDKYTKEFSDKRCYSCYIIRLIYACGLRISETINIKVDDINFNENTINIINSKRNVSRIIVFSDSMKQCLLDYINTFKIIEGFLFQINKNQIVMETLRTFYKKVLSLAKLNINAHIYDLRHCFCNKAFNQMLIFMIFVIVFVIKHLIKC